MFTWADDGPIDGNAESSILRQRSALQILSAQLRSIALVSAVGVTVGACERSLAPGSGSNTPLPSPAPITTVPASALSGDALAALGPDGRFARAATQLPAPFPIMTSFEAESVTTAWWRVWGGAARLVIGDDRGAPVSLTLTLCGPAQYAESSVGPSPDTATIRFRIRWGPRWVVTLCDGAEQVAVVAVAAFASPLAGAGLIGPADTLVDVGIVFQGIPVGVRYPMNPEEAAARAAALTGRRIDSLPRLVLARPSFVQWLAMWSVSLDSAVSVRGLTTGRVRARQVLWYGLIPSARWLMTVADRTSESDYGPYLTGDTRRLPDGSLRVDSILLGRLPVPSFAQSEAVALVVPVPS